MRNIWFFADPHFGHAKIIKYCDRPFRDVDHMNETLVANYNSLVGSSDTVYILGDFAWKEHAKFAFRLNGKKTLLLGNHDKFRAEDRRAFTEVIGGGGTFGLREINIDKRKVTLCHFPLASWNASFHGSWHLHGHCHGTLPETAGLPRADVGVDVWGYFPVSWDQIVKKMTGLVAEGEQDENKYDGVGSERRMELARGNLAFRARPS